MPVEQPTPSAPIVGPAKWFAAGAIFTAAVSALTITLVLRDPRPLQPLVATTTVTTGPESSASAPAPADPVIAQPAISAAAPPAASIPNLTTASTPQALVVPVEPVERAEGTAPKDEPTAPKPDEAPAIAPAPSVDPGPKPVPLVEPEPKPKVEPKPAPAVGPKPIAPGPSIAGGSINVNTASQAELELLPQIGPALASRIIEYRTTHGRFKSLADLDKVRGIGPKTLTKLKGLVRFE